MKGLRRTALLVGAVCVLIITGTASAKNGPSEGGGTEGTAVTDNTATANKPGAVAGTPTTLAGADKVPAATGDVGPSAPPPLQREVVSATFTNPAFTQSFGSVACPSGKVAWGGGLFGSSTSLFQNINSSYPTVSGGIAIGWSGYMNNASSSSSSFTVYAVCAIKPKAYSIQSATFTNPAGSQSSGSVLCPLLPSGKRSKAFGGGAFGSSPSTAQNINTSIPDSINSWRVDMNNGSASSSSFTVYVVCGKRAGYKIITGAAVSNPPSTQTFASASCPSTKVSVGGGGFSSSGSTSVNMNSTFPSGSLAWGVYENNATSFATTITPYVVCVTP